MTLDTATSQYELVERLVAPDNLLLDPNNPRLKSDDFRHINLKSDQIAEPSVQSALLEKICSDEHAVKPLMVSISNQGFVELDALLAKRIQGSEKFVVLEGNRRTAAIKRILSDPSAHSASVLASLEKITIKEIVCDDNADEQSIVDSIVALRHISGPKDWQPMQRAFAIHSTYVRQFAGRYEHSPLSYSANVTREVAFMLAQTPVKIREEVAIFSVFQQLQAEGCQVRSDHYSLIQLLLSKPRFASEYFDFNRQQLKMGASGLEAFVQLCIDSDCAVRNPRDFRHVYRVFKDGCEADIRLIASGSRSIANVLGDIKDRRRSSQFLDQSKQILSGLENLKVSGFNETDEEAQIVMRIKGLVDRRLWPLAAKYLEVDEK